MTLHEAKNKESEKRGYTNFEALLNYCFSIQDPSLAFEVLEEAALQAIQSAREEGQKEWFEKGYLSGAYRASHESWKEAYDNEITATGR